MGTWSAHIAFALQFKGIVLTKISIQCFGWLPVTLVNTVGSCVPPQVKRVHPQVSIILFSIKSLSSEVSCSTFFIQMQFIVISTHDKFFSQNSMHRRGLQIHGVIDILTCDIVGLVDLVC